MESNFHPPREVARRVALAASLLIALANRPSAVLAQSAPPPAPAADLLQRIRALGLPSSTDRLTVYYSPGHEAKAVRLRTLIQDARQFFADSLGISPELSIAVLERPTWERVITDQPYGIPGIEGAPPVAFLPATDDNLAANDALSLEAAISDTARRLIAASGRTWTEASKRYVDLVGLHELGHAFAAAYGIDVPSQWFNEWLATYFCYTYLRAARPVDAKLWEGILQGYRDAAHPEHRTIDAFERLYFAVGAQNYVWYQARFQQQVQRVHDEQGVTFLRRLKQAFPRGATRMASRDELLHRLDAIEPGFGAWAATMR
ncbi:hypothetical protein [Gemmatimonas sp.]|uniref:hypothetical protein n=1 Tax=Gemmatimonas sp. TaxID=1962908 RepID=UPI003562B66F